MKRYLAFSYDSFYPLGGWHDYLGTFDSVLDATLAWQKEKYRCQFLQIVDTDTMKAIREEELI